MKGQKTGGRTKGSVNKVPALTKEVNREAIGSFLSKYINEPKESVNPGMEKDWELLDPKDRIMVAERMMQYVVPKVQATQLEVADNGRKQSSLELTLKQMSKPD